jgi:hypothetical protein
MYIKYCHTTIYNPSKLSSFPSKTTEKLVDRHVRGGALKEKPLHQNQHAYQTGKSTETALHSVVTCIENAIKHKVLALGAFLDIEGAFDRTSHDTIKQAAEKHGIEPAVCRWICAMLESRNIVFRLAGDTMRASVARGCPQGSVLSPLLWSLVIDDLIWELNKKGYYTVGYADDIAILINGRFPNTVSEVLQTALGTVQQWCDRTKLYIIPKKMVVIPFTRKRNIKGPKEPILFNKRIQLSNKIKYLGIIIDKGLTWKSS